MNKKISVIIPVYNTNPEFLQKAINSVLNQTYKNIEVIIVNDGSTDNNTLNFLKTLDNKNINIINQENKGLGGARNTGINSATGDYIGFLDADDWLDKNFYEVLFNLCENNDADIACGMLTRATKFRKIKMEYFKDGIYSNFSDKMGNISNGSVCSKLFRKSLFENVRFIEHIYWEDNPVLVELLLKSNKVAFTTKVRYLYRKNTSSICLNIAPEKEEKRQKDGLFILKQLYNLPEYKNEEEKKIVMSIFIPVLFNKSRYEQDNEYKKETDSFLNENYESFIKPQKIINRRKENIFSIKLTPTGSHKIFTILGLKLKIKRKNKNDKK